MSSAKRYQLLIQLERRNGIRLCRLKPRNLLPRSFLAMTYHLHQ